MKNTVRTRLLALLLVLVMVCGLLPTAMATDTSSSVEEVTETIVSEPEPSVEPSTVQSTTPSTQSDAETAQSTDSSAETTETADTGPVISTDASDSAPACWEIAQSAESSGNSGSAVINSVECTLDTDPWEDGETVTYTAINAPASTYATTSSSATGTKGESLYFQTAEGSTGWLHFEYTDALGESWSCSYKFISPHYLNGEPAYCIEPTVDFYTNGTYYTEDAATAWYSRLTEDQRYAIALALAYGYPNQTYSRDPTDHTDSKYNENMYIQGTQAVIWEIVSGQRSATAPYALTGTAQGYGYDGAIKESWKTILYVRDQIVAKMAAHKGLPSFASATASSASTFELAYDASTGLYKTTLTDTNGVLSDYTVTTSISGLSFTKSGNNLTITATAAAAASLANGVSFSAQGTSLAVYSNNVIVWEASVSGKQALATMDLPATARGYFNLKAESTGGLTLVKKSSNTEMVAKNACYSLVGTTYGLYSDSSCTNKVGTFTVNADGSSNTITGLAAGTYYYKELTAGTGYELDTTVRSVTVTAGQTNTITAYDTPNGDPLTITIEKENADAASYASANPLSLAGAKFSITYYSGYYSTEAAAESAASAGTIQKRTWYITTQEYTVGGVTKYATWMGNGTVTGDALFYNNAGNIVVPHGTIVIKEVSAPTGYVNSADFHITGSTTSLGSSVILQYDGSGKAKSVTTGNYLTDDSLTVYEPAIFGGVAVQKVDSDNGSATAQGDATLGKATFGIYNNSDNAVYVGGKEYVKGALVTTITTDGTGYAATAKDALPYGNYYLQEISAPTGYTLSSEKISFTLNQSLVVLSIGNYSDTVIKGTIKLTKAALNTVTGESQPEKGATFQVWLKSAGSYAKAKDTEKDVITIGEDGTGTSKALPYGTYCIQQTSGWNGYDLNESVFEATISANGTVVTKDTSGNNLSINNNIWTGTISIVKQDGDTQEPLSGAEFTLTGDNGTKVTAITDKDGKVVFEDLYYGVNYTWTETAAPKGYLLNEDNTGTWTVDQHDATLVVTCDDYRRPGSITVTKQDSDGKPLAGCTFLLEYLDGTTWKPVTYRAADPITKGGCTSDVVDGCLTTDKTGTVTFSGLWADDELQYRLTEVSAPEGYTLLTTSVFEGVLPISYPEGEVSATPDETIQGTAYFYDLPITVKDGKVYVLPMTGGSNFPLIPVALMLLAMGALLLGTAQKFTKKEKEKAQ